MGPNGQRIMNPDEAKGGLEKAQAIEAAAKDWLAKWIAAKKAKDDANAKISVAKDQGQLSAKAIEEARKNITILDLQAPTAKNTATAEQAKRDSENAKKREALELELQLNEAKNAGNDKEARRLEWIKEYNRVLTDARALGVDGADSDSMARRSANAKDGQHHAGPAEHSIARLVTAQMSGASAARLASMAVSQRGSGEQILSTLNQFLNVFNTARNDPVEIKFKR